MDEFKIHSTLKLFFKTFKLHIIEDYFILKVFERLKPKKKYWKINFLREIIYAFSHQDINYCSNKKIIYDIAWNYIREGITCKKILL